jgi:hypothetical protein
MTDDAMQFKVDAASNSYSAAWKGESHGVPYTRSSIIVYINLKPAPRKVTRNPYSGTGFDNLNDFNRSNGSARSNPNALTVAPTRSVLSAAGFLGRSSMSKPRPSKKQKVDKECIRNVTSPDSFASFTPHLDAMHITPASDSNDGSPRKHSATGKSSLHTTYESSGHQSSLKRVEVINVDQEEDLGEPVWQSISSALTPSHDNDDLQIVAPSDQDQNAFNVSKLRGISVVDGRASSNRLRSSYKDEEAPVAGPHTRTIVEKYRRTDPDPIEDADDSNGFTPPLANSRPSRASPSIPIGNVKNKVAQYEPRPPEVDLKAMRKKPKRSGGSSRVANMKRKVCPSPISQDTK